MGKTLKILVDTIDLSLINRHKWSINSRGYVQRKEENPRKHYLLHREILNVTESKCLVDHINGNKLDNRRANLRLATPSQNQANAKKSKNNTSGFKGVSWHASSQKFQARLCFNRKLIALGLFKTAIEAAYAYNKAAVLYFGEFAKLNKL